MKSITTTIYLLASAIFFCACSSQSSSGKKMVEVNEIYTGVSLNKQPKDAMSSQFSKVLVTRVMILFL